MKATSEKCHLLTTEEEKDITVMGDKIKNNASEKLLGITIDSKLSLNKHVNKICDISGQKLNALARVSSFMSTVKRRITMFQ